MKKKKQNNKLTITKLKNAFLESIRELYASFIKIPVKVRYILGVWGFLFILLISLIAFSNMNNKKLDHYHAFEEEMNVAMLDYVTKNSIYATNEKYFKMSLDALLSESSLTNSSDTDTCIGYSIAYYNDEKDTDKDEDKYRIQSFLHCNQYTTEHYNDYK